MRDRTKVRRCHLAVGNLEIEFRLDGKHEVDHVERGEPARSEIVIVPDGTINRALGKKAAH